MVCLLAVMLEFVCVCWGFVAAILWVYEIVLLWCVCGCPTVVCVKLSYCGMCEAVLLWYVCCCSSVVCVWVSYCGMCEAVLLWYV